MEGVVVSQPARRVCNRARPVEGFWARERKAYRWRLGEDEQILLCREESARLLSCPCQGDTLTLLEWIWRGPDGVDEVEFWAFWLPLPPCSVWAGHPRAFSASVLDVPFPSIRKSTGVNGRDKLT